MHANGNNELIRVEMYWLIGFPCTNSPGAMREDFPSSEEKRKVMLKPVLLW